MSVRAVLAPDEMDQLRNEFRAAYHEYVAAGERSSQFLSSLGGREQSAEDLQSLLELQAAESRAYSRYNEARLAYVSAVFAYLR